MKKNKYRCPDLYIRRSHENTSKYLRIVKGHKAHKIPLLSLRDILPMSERNPLNGALRTWGGHTNTLIHSLNSPKYQPSVSTWLSIFFFKLKYLTKYSPTPYPTSTINIVISQEGQITGLSGAHGQKIVYGTSTHQEATFGKVIKIGNIDISYGTSPHQEAVYGKVVEIDNISIKYGTSQHQTATFSKVVEIENGIVSINVITVELLVNLN